MAIIKSVLAILKHENHFFFIVRQNHLRVFPGYASFPGGKIEKNEAAWEGVGEEPVIMGALRRELKEELSFDLEEEAKKGSVKDVRIIGSAVTPDFNPYRFDAVYVLVELERRPKFELDEKEVAKGFWATFDEFEREFRKGDLMVIPPMWKIRHYFEDLKSGRQSFNYCYDDKKVPTLESIYGVKQIMPLSNTLPPASRTNAFLIGGALVDPSPKDEGELSKFLETIKGSRIDCVFITHHHGDHHQFAGEIAKKLGVPIYMSKFTRDRLVKLGGQDYFSDVQAHLVSEGEEIGRWLGSAVRVYEVPGHDQGQLALAPDCMKWFIAGDLFQGIGTVVVGGEEGNMAAYFRTLQRVIDLGPAVVYPSHGIPLGGTHILQKTLKHRRLREEQVKAHP